MKKIILILCLIILTPIFWAACGHKDSTLIGEKKQSYTCPMHRFIHVDHPGKCPICGMELIPEDDKLKNTSESQPSQVLSIEPEKLQRIGIKTEKVIRKNLEREIIVSARVAYDPELWVAEQEYQLALKNGESGLIQATQKRLLTLGMSQEQIQILKKQKSESETLWIYGSLFEQDLDWVKVGDSVTIESAFSSETLTSKVFSIDPRIDTETRTARLRILLPSTLSLKPDTFVKLKIHAQTSEVLAVPVSAIVDTGTRQLVFVELGGGYFDPREIKSGKRGSDFLEVLSGLNENEAVVTSGNFLIDAESKLRTFQP